DHAIGLRGAPGPGDLAVKRVDVAPGDFRHLHVAKRRPDVAPEDAFVAVSSVGTFAAHVLVEEPLDQIIHGRRAAFSFDLAQWIAAGVDHALELASFLTRTNY